MSHADFTASAPDLNRRPTRHPAARLALAAVLVVLAGCAAPAPSADPTPPTGVPAAQPPAETPGGDGQPGGLARRAGPTVVPPADPGTRPMTTDEFVNADVVMDCFVGAPEAPNALAFEFDLYGIGGNVTLDPGSLDPGATFELGCTELGPPKHVDDTSGVPVESPCNPFADVPSGGAAGPAEVRWDDPEEHVRLRWMSSEASNHTKVGSGTIPNAAGYVQPGETAHFGYSLAYQPGGPSGAVPHTMVARYLMTAAPGATPEPGSDCAAPPVSVSVSTPGAFTGTLTATIGAGLQVVGDGPPAWDGVASVHVEAWPAARSFTLDDLVAGSDLFDGAPAATFDLRVAPGRPESVAVPVPHGAQGVILRGTWRTGSAVGATPGTGRTQPLTMTTYHGYPLVWRAVPTVRPPIKAPPSDR